VKYKFLWNMLDARSTPDETERRLRIRYAAVSAVQALGYLPLRDSVLVPINLSAPGKNGSQPELTLIGYFESFQTLDATKELQRVCLIWTPKQFPINDKIVHAVTAQIAKLDEVTAISAGEKLVHVFHYGTSDDLDYYLQTPKDSSQDVEVSFLYATMPISSSPNVSSPVLRPLVTDDILVQALATELKLRLPALNCTKQQGSEELKLPRIVIFTESNTKYSRAMVSELGKRLPNTRQEVYSYLRGLDGLASDARSGITSDSSSQKAISPSQDNADSETSFGTSQFDYLRRTAVGLEGKRSRDREDRIVAVGVLGSDIYDKMLVLQAIQPELPSALFFTTDLDALYFKSEMEPVTRNLIVASGDDLDTNHIDERNGDWRLPPMRDSYQSMLVQEVRRILALKPPIPTDKRSAHMYEIAPGRSINLDPEDPRAQNVNQKASQYWLHLLAPDWMNGVIFALGLLNGFLILWAIFARLDENSSVQRWTGNGVTGSEILLATSAVLFLVYQLSWSHRRLLWSEPLSLGVSIWPSVMIRLIAFIVAILLLMIASRSFIFYAKEAKEKLEEALGENCALSWKPIWQHTPKTESLHAWLEELLCRKARIRRIILASVLYLLLSCCLFIIWPATTPARGAAPLWIEKAVLAFGVALYIIHLMFCIDLHVSAYRFLRVLPRVCTPAALESPHDKINVTATLAAVADLTSVIGRTLLFPLTVLILIILSRLRLFDNWRMTMSLSITFAAGAVLLIGASMLLWLEGARLKRAVLLAYKDRSRIAEQLQQVSGGVFAPWYSQPIFSAILSAAAVFGSVSVAGPIVRLLLS